MTNSSMGVNTAGVTGSGALTTVSSPAKACSRSSDMLLFLMVFFPYHNNPQLYAVR